MLNGEQIAIVLHVDDLKLSHKDSKVVSVIIAKLESIYAAIDLMASLSMNYHGLQGSMGSTDNNV